MSRVSTVRVVLVDDDALVRTGLRFLLGGADGVEVVGEAADGLEALAVVERCAPDVVLMDLRMPRLDGVRATERVRALPRAPQVVALTTFDSDAEVVGALRAGAAAYLLKDTEPAELVRALRAVAAGESVLSPAVTRQVVDLVRDGAAAGERRSRARDEAARRLAAVAPGELAVARAVARGLTNAEIAAEQHLSVATVKAYVSRALTALDLTNRVQLALLVAEAGRDAGSDGT